MPRPHLSGQDVIEVTGGVPVPVTTGKFLIILTIVTD
jgi:hypothetical protein